MRKHTHIQRENEHALQSRMGDWGSKPKPAVSLKAGGFKGSSSCSSDLVSLNKAREADTGYRSGVNISWSDLQLFGPFHRPGGEWEKMSARLLFSVVYLCLRTGE